jgi:biotin synthase-like enzyme
MTTKHDWMLLEVEAVHNLPLSKSMVRLSAGRLQLSDEAQAVCFLAGANSILWAKNYRQPRIPKQIGIRGC